MNSRSYHDSVQVGPIFTKCWHQLKAASVSGVNTTELICTSLYHHLITNAPLFTNIINVISLGTSCFLLTLHLYIHTDLYL